MRPLASVSSGSSPTVNPQGETTNSDTTPRSASTQDKGDKGNHSGGGHSSHRGPRWGAWLALSGIVAAGTVVLLEWPRITKYLAADVHDHYKKPRIVILGSGWSALATLAELNPKYYDITVVSPRNYFLFTPLLPSLTVGTTEAPSICEPIRDFCHRNATDATFLHSECTRVDPKRRVITCRDVHSDSPFEMEYDMLVLAVGCGTNTFRTPGVEEHAHFLKEAPHAFAIRHKVLNALEAANSPTLSDGERDRLLQFVVVGGGPTGVEFAAELNDFVHDEVNSLFPHIAKHVKITLIQSSDHILNTYDVKISEYAEQNFQREGIDLLTNSRVKEVLPHSVKVMDKVSREMREIPFGLCVWATGIRTRPLIKSLMSSLEGQNNRNAIVTDGHLQVIGAHGIFALGDCATIQQDRLMNDLKELYENADADGSGVLSKQEFHEFIRDAKLRYPQVAEFANKIEQLFLEGDKNGDGEIDREEFSDVLSKIDAKVKALPATAQVANQQGAYLGQLLNQMALDADANWDGTFTPSGPSFEYDHYGSLAYVGGDHAAYEKDNIVMSGWATMLLWRGIYLSKSVSMRTKLLLGLDWIKHRLFGRDTSLY